MAVKESLRNVSGGKETKREHMRAQGHMPPRVKYDSVDSTGPGNSRSSSDGNGLDETHPELSDTWKHMGTFSGIVDRKGRVQFATEEPVKALGYTEDDLIGKPFWESTWFKPSQAAQDLVKECLLGALGGSCVECRVDTYDKEGDTYPMTFIMSPMKGKDGGIVSIVAHPGLATHKVESEANNAEQELLKKVNDRLLSVFELTQEGYFETDATGKLTLASPHCANLLGYQSTDDLVGRWASDYWVDAVDKSKVFELLEEQGKVESHETSLLNRNGGEIPVEIYARAVTDDKGVVVESRFVFCDISEKKSWAQKLMDDSAATEAEESDLADVELAWANWMDESDDGVGVIQDGMVVFANPTLAEMAGYDSVAGLEGRSVPEVFSTESVSEVSSVEDWANGGYFRSPLNLGLVKRDGKVATVETSIIPGPHEGTSYSIVIVREILNRGHVRDDSNNGKERFEALWSNPLQMAFVNDLKGRFIEANEATLDLLGYTLDEMMASRTRPYHVSKAL
ncbi:MAG: PAS domain S-box protein [Chloroflexota bacterium]|nr:PAS domain S-box protein [Chloroflexota bacterium]